MGFVRSGGGVEETNEGQYERLRESGGGDDDGSGKVK